MPILVHSIPMSRKKFTQADIEISKKYINPDVYPGLYNKDDIPAGLQYVDRELINIKDITFDDEDAIDNTISQKSRHMSPDEALTQSNRVNGRGVNSENVWYHMETYGYKLDNIPMSIAIFPDGSKFMINGRTRLQKLVQSGFKNFIADVYKCNSREGYHEAIQLFNFRVDPNSPHTMEDIVMTCQYAIKRGWIKNSYDDIKKKVEKVAPGCFLPNEVNKIIVRAMNTEISSSISWTSKAALKEIRQLGFIDNENNNGIYYFVYSAEAPVKAIMAASKYLQEDLAGKRVKELRVVIHTGTLQGSDPEASWKNKIDGFRTLWKDYTHYIKDSFFTVNSEFKHVIKLFGALPAVSSLKEDFPMDRLVMFHVGKLKNGKLFSQMSFDTGMAKSMFVEETDNESEFA